MKKNTQSDDLRILQNEKNDICISIIVPTHPLPPERRTDAKQLQKVIQQVENQLLSKYNNEAADILIRNIDELYKEIDFVHNSAGIGLYVSKNVKMLIHFFFPVKEKIIINRSFDIRDFLYESCYDIPYVVLMLSHNEIRLLNGRLNILTAVSDPNFPKKNDAEYEYSRPSRGSSYVGNSNVKEFEKDKSVTEETRLKSFFREADKLLNGYLGRETPLIIAGENKDLVCFMDVTTHAHDTVCNIRGNYMMYNEFELGKLTWKAMKLFLDNGKEKLISDLREKIGAGLAISGNEIGEIWKAVLDGRGYKLIVEKDYSIPGYLSKNNDYELYLHPPKHEHSILPDIINRLITLTLEKDGEVIVVENDALRDHMRLALITRY